MHRVIQNTDILIIFKETLSCLDDLAELLFVQAHCRQKERERSAAGSEDSRLL